MVLASRSFVAALAIGVAFAAGCGGNGGPGGAGGRGGTQGSAGRGGTTGVAGSGGTTGPAGTGGAAGTGGTNGVAGTGGGGTTGSAGTGGGGTTGSAGTGGTTGSAGAGGVAGSGGTTGAAGIGGAAGTSGAAGSTGGMTGSAGTGGTAGVGGTTGSAGIGGAAGAGGTTGIAGTGGATGTGGTAGAAGTGGAISLSCGWRGDFDGDGVADCARAQVGSGPMLDLVFNKGLTGGGYGAVGVVTPNVVPTDYKSYSLASSTIDLNHDSRQDIIISASDPLSFGMYEVAQLFRGQADGTFAPFVRSCSPCISGSVEGLLLYGRTLTSSTTVADFDGDGFPDVLTVVNMSPPSASYKDIHWIVLMSAGGLDFHLGGGLAAQQLFGGPFVKAVVDLNGDGKLDIVALAQPVPVSIGRGDPSYVIVSIGTGGGNFTTTRISGTDQAGNVSVSDLNGDGKLDLLVTLAAPTPFYGDGTGQFSTTPP